LLAAAMLLPLPVEAAKGCRVQIFIYKDGDVGVDGTRYSDRAQLKLRLSEYKQRKTDCEVILKGDQMVRYDAVARVLAMLQGIGYLKVGFVSAPHSD
jgi:biopolymer transport protein ExbD